MSVDRTRGIAIVGAGVVLVAMVAVLLWQRQERAPLPTFHGSAAAVDAGIGAPSSAHGRPAALPVPGVVPEPNGGAPGVSTDDPLTAYKKANVYPPGSRPLGPTNVDLLQPNRRHEQARPTDADDGVTFLLTADRYFVIGAQPLAITLEVTKDGAPLPFAIAQAFAAVLDPANPSPAKQPIAFTGRTAMFAPAALGLARQTAFGVYVEFTYAGGRQRASFDFQYTPVAGIPAAFTGQFHDAVEGGSLAIHTGIAVAHAGHYVIDCNLYDAADAPVAWTHWKGDLAAGTADAPLVFFGKVLADAGARGPFHIGQLRGARFEPGTDPDLEQMASYPGTYATAAYPATAFSDAEYDSADKQKMIDFLTQQQAKGVHQGAAGRGDHGSPGDDH